jgi:hypothetical protein
VSWTVGERVFVDRELRKNLREFERHCDSVRLSARESDHDIGNPTLTTSGLE